MLALSFGAKFFDRGPGAFRDGLQQRNLFSAPLPWLVVAGPERRDPTSFAHQRHGDVSAFTRRLITSLVIRGGAWIEFRIGIDDSVSAHHLAGRDAAVFRNPMLAGNR